MIASLTGTIETIETDYTIITVHGIGFHVRMPSSDLARLKTGQETRILTSLTITQDAASLTGFLTPTERDLYTQLLKVNGIGPKAALSILSTFTPDQLADIITRHDITALTRVPGLGKKSAQKIILDLAGTLTTSPTPTPDSTPTDPVAQNLIDAMVTMGKDRATAQKAIEQAIQTLTIPTPVPDDTTIQSAILSLAFRTTDTK